MSVRRFNRCRSAPSPRKVKGVSLFASHAISTAATSFQPLLLYTLVPLHEPKRGLLRLWWLAILASGL